MWDRPGPRSASEPKPEYFKFEPVLTTYNPADAAIIRPILDGKGIPYDIQGENFMHIRPPVEPARRRVDHDSVETVQALLKELNLLFTGLSLNKTKEAEEVKRMNNDPVDD
ncbi:MAG: hypothetical protein EPO39_00610 [Candidatus Manganitrophaceae bacterium]|nr:MAG: hypothetical protein EPO39_00610 [Candidatus Manganitrophaceae bacterium]